MKTIIVDAKKLFMFRKEKYSNQEDFAKLIGIKYKTYAGKEKSGKFSIAEIKKISNILKCKPEDLELKEVKRLTKEDIAALRATVRVLSLSVQELKMRESGKSLVEITQEFEKMIKLETEQILNEGP